MSRDPLKRPPVPAGYAVRLAFSHHLGGWKPCPGLLRCAQCLHKRSGYPSEKTGRRRRQNCPAARAHPLRQPL